MLSKVAFINALISAVSAGRSKKHTASDAGADDDQAQFFGMDASTI